MYGNGVAIGIVAVIIQARHKPILQVPIVGRTACTVAVAGPATIGTVAFRIVTATTRRTASTTSASGLRSKVNFSFQKATSFHAFHYNFQFEALHGVCFHPSRKAVSEGRAPPQEGITLIPHCPPCDARDVAQKPGKERALGIRISGRRTTSAIST